MVAVGIGIAARLDLADRPIDYDSANYAYVATRMSAFGARYLDFFNNKPPGIYAWYRAAFALFGNGPLACHLTSAVPDLVVLLLLSVLARRLAGDRVANLAAALYATLEPAVRLSGYGYTESPVAALTMGAALLAAWAPGCAQALGAGLLMGTATLFKQPAFLLAAGLGAWGAMRVPHELRARWLGYYGAGILCVEALLVAWLLSSGALGTFLERVFWQGVSRGYAGGLDLAARANDWRRSVLAPMPVTAPLAALALASRRASRTRALGWALVLPLVAMGLASYEFYDHYLIPALPLLALVLAEWLVTIESRRLRHALGFGLVATHGLGLWVFVTGQPPRGGPFEAWLAGWRARPLTLTYQRRVASYVQSRTPDGEPMLSTGTEIPYLAGRRNAYRFLGVAPYLGQLDATGFSDFPAAAEHVRVMVLERWRLTLLPKAWVESLDAPSGPWRSVDDLAHPEFVVYARR